MKKVLAVSAIGLVAICVITPKFIAPKYEAKVSELVNSINQAKGYSATVESSESSWFGSKKTVLVNLDLGIVNPALGNESVNAKFNIDTHYGPILLSGQGLLGLFSSDITLDNEALRDNIDWDKNAPLYQASVVSGLFGGVDFADQIPELKEKNNQFHTSPYKGEGSISADKVTYNGGFDTASFNGQSETDVKDFEVSLNLDANWATIQKGGFYNSDMSFKLSEVSLASEAMINDLALNIKTALDEKAQLGNVQVGYNVKALSVDDFKIDDLKLVTQVNNLNNQVFIDYSKLLKESDSFNAMQQDAFLQNNLENILASKPEVNITELSGSTKDGHFTATLDSKLADIEAPSIAQLNDPRFWLYNAIINANLEADKPLFETFVNHYVAKKMFVSPDSPQVQQQSKQLIDTLVQQGLFKLENEKYTTMFHAQNGQGHIYDLTIPIM